MKSTARKDSPEASRFLRILERLLAQASPRGCEHGMAVLIRKEIEALGYSCEQDGARNLLVRVPGRDASAPTSVFAAHMDEIAVVVTAIEDGGILKVERSGQLKPFKLGERPLEFFGDVKPVIGMISLGGGHGASIAALDTWDGIPVLTGMTREELDACGIRPGTSGVPVREGCGPILFGGEEQPLVGAWTLDDRAGVAILLMLLEDLKKQAIQPPGPVIIAFTVHEEGGCHGAKFLANHERPDYFFAVDGCPFIPGCGYGVNEKPTCWSMDALGHYDQDLLRTLGTAANEAGTKAQTAVLTGGHSDATSAYSIGAVGKVACIGHTRYNSHGYEVARLDVFPNILRTLTALFQMDKWL